MKLGALLLTLALTAFAQTAGDKMVQSSVVVFGTVQENGKPKAVSRGGGFMLDSRHVVTNLSACCDKTVPVVVLGEKDASAAKVVWSNADADIAILEMKDAFQRPALTLATFKSVEKDQVVYTAQFPNPGEAGTTPKLIEGKITGLVKIDKTGVEVYKTTSSMNKANSGGALFDACGNVIGINMMMKDGAQFAYVIDPLLKGLSATGLKTPVTDVHCGSSASEKKQETSSRREWRLPEGVEWTPVVLLLAAIAMAFRPSKKKASAVVRQQPLPEPATYAPLPQVAGGTGTRPALRGVEGQYAGKSFALDAGPSVLGRDQRAVNLVFASDAHSISKRHCMVSWDAARRTFVLEDLGSTNGTFLSTGERLTAGRAYDLPAGSRFFIGDLRNQFEVRMD